MASGMKWVSKVVKKLSSVDNLKPFFAFFRTQKFNRVTENSKLVEQKKNADINASYKKDTCNDLGLDKSVFC